MGNSVAAYIKTTSTFETLMVAHCEKYWYSIDGGICGFEETELAIPAGTAESWVLHMQGESSYRPPEETASVKIKVLTVRPP